jgi:hypothetical protein
MPEFISTPILVTALSTITPNVTRQIVQSDGYSSAGDGGGGAFAWNATDTRTTDGGTIIAVTGIATGRWNRVFSGDYNVKWFGVHGDGSTNDTTNIQVADAAAQVGNGTLFFPSGTYVCTTLTINSRIRFEVGAMLAPSVVANLYGSIFTSPQQQIFTAAAVVNFSNQSVIKPVVTNEVWAAWWGAKGDWAGGSTRQGPQTSTDNTIPFRSAIYAASTCGHNGSGSIGGRVRLGRGLFRITDSITIDSTPFSSYTARANNTPYTAGALYVPAVANGYYYVCVTSGTSAASPPVFTTQINASYADGYAVFQCISTTTPTGQAGVIISGENSRSSGFSQDTLIAVDFTEPSGSVAQFAGHSNNTATVTGLTGMKASDVGTWIFFSNANTPANNGAYQITTYVNATSVVVTEITSETIVTTDLGVGSVGLLWFHTTRSALRVWSQDCKIENITFVPCDIQAIYAFVEDTQTPSGSSICTNNQFENLYMQNRYSGAFVHGYSHADNPLSPGRNTNAFGNCDFNSYRGCQVANALFAGWYNPSTSAQVINIEFEFCSFSAETIQPSGYWGANLNPRACIYSEFGSFTIEDSSLSYTELGIFLGDGIFYCVGLQSEGLGRVLKQNNSSTAPCVATFVGGRVAVNGINADDIHIKFRGSGSLTLIGVAWDPVFTTGFKIDVANNGPPTSLVVIGCFFPCLTPFTLSGYGAGIYGKVTSLGNAGAFDGTGAGKTIHDIVSQSVNDGIPVITGANSNIINVEGTMTLVDPGGNFSLSGFIGGQQGARISLIYTGANTVTFTNLATSTAANQILCSTAADIVKSAPSAGGFWKVDLVYDQDVNSGAGAWMTSG